MAEKKKWLFGCLILLLCTSFVVVYASIIAGGTEDKTEQTEADVSFSDVQEDDWFYDDVQFVKENGLMTGTDEHSFSPNDVTTRGMIVTVLWRNEGSPKSEYTGFKDVKSDRYYFEAVSWAFENKIVSGYDSQTFGADDFITREQLATIMYRYAGYKMFDTSNKVALTQYADKNEINEYAQEAFKWAIANRIITGTSDNTISPQGNALRCQVAAILRRFSVTYPSSNQDITGVDDRTDNIISGNGNSSASSSSNGKTPVNDKADQDEKKPSISLSNVTANKGEDVQLIANINNNPGILGMTLSVYYDTDNLILENVESGTVFKNKLDMTTSKDLTSGTKIVWDGIEIDEKDIQDGEFLIMRFHIPDSAQAGKYPISLSYTSGDIVDNDLSSVEVQIEKGYINIKN